MMKLPTTAPYDADNNVHNGPHNRKSIVILLRDPACDHIYDDPLRTNLPSGS